MGSAFRTYAFPGFLYLEAHQVQSAVGQDDDLATAGLVHPSIFLATLVFGRHNIIECKIEGEVENKSVLNAEYTAAGAWESLRVSAHQVSVLLARCHFTTVCQTKHSTLPGPHHSGE